MRIVSMCEGREIFKTHKQYKAFNTIWHIISYFEICFSLDHFQCFIKQDCQFLKHKTGCALKSWWRSICCWWEGLDLRSVSKYVSSFLPYLWSHWKKCLSDTEPVSLPTVSDHYFYLYHSHLGKVINNKRKMTVAEQHDWEMWQWHEVSAKISVFKKKKRKIFLKSLRNMFGLVTEMENISNKEYSACSLQELYLWQQV